jgi:hypothetical protein
MEFQDPQLTICCQCNLECEQIGLHCISIPEGWKVKEEESHSEECSISIDEQVQKYLTEKLYSGWLNIWKVWKPKETQT